MTSKTEIANLALLLLGDSSVLDITDNSVRAKAMNLAYDTTRKALLRSYDWNFARGRVVLAKDTETPVFGLGFQYTLPAGSLKVRMDNTVDQRDFIVEGLKIFTDVDTSIDLKYTKDVTDPNIFDPLFVEAFAAKLALKTANKIIGSTSGVQLAQLQFDDAIREARRVSAFEQHSEEPPEDDWVLARL